MPLIRFSADAVEYQAAEGDWLYDVCVEAKATIPYACKAGACGTCATEVLEGGENLGTQTQRELRTLTGRKVNPQRYRLPCLGTVHGPVTFGKSEFARQAAKLVVREAEVESYRRLNANVADVRFYVPQTEGSPGFAFKPGQYVILQLPDGTITDGKASVVRRSYSIASLPSDRKHFELCVRAVAGGQGSNYVHRMRPGDRIKFEGPHGEFALRDGGQGDRPIVMVANGTGLAPIKSMLLHLVETRSHRRIRLFFGVRAVHDVFHTDFLRGLAASYPNFQYEIALSSPDASRWAGPGGRVTERIESAVSPEEARSSEAYLCGGQTMIADVTSQLVAKGMSVEAIRSEAFY